ncbi:MAG: hypothetical protein WBH47_25505 [Streptosporangiaceae bacterium]
MTDQYLDGVYRCWHLTPPSPELLAADEDADLIALSAPCLAG